LFKVNTYNSSEQLFTAKDYYSDKISSILKKSWAICFRENVFSKIDEKKFRCLFKEHDASRPNKPINILLGLEIIKELFDYTDDELIEQFHLNLSIIVALGLSKVGEMTLGERTLYNFRNRILEYENKTGINLYEQEFKTYRAYLIRRFNLKTDQQRTDSFLVGSNIRKMSRVELITKMIQLLFEKLNEDDKNRLNRDFEAFLGDEPYRLIYKKTKDEISNMLESGLQKLELLLEKLSNNNDNSDNDNILEVGERLLKEQCLQREDGKWRLKDSKDISSESIQSLYDLEATYRKKGKKECRGYIDNIVETCNQENNFQIITDISLEKSSVDDGKHMAKRLDVLIEETEINELIGDGGYDSEDLYEKCNNKENPVKLITTGIRGKAPNKGELTSLDFKINDNQIRSCPQGVKPETQRYNAREKKIVAKFNLEKCKDCPVNKNCPGSSQKKYYSVVITKNKIKSDIKRNLIKNDKVYREKCRLRPAVESSVWQFNKDLKNGKVRFRGKVKIHCRMLLKGIGINFKRVLMMEKDLMSAFFYQLFKFVKLIKGWNMTQVQKGFCT
jgi:hypothetical protein